MINGTIREKILKPCDDPLLNTIDDDVRYIWDGLGCYYLHGVLDYDWYMNQSRTDYSYVEYGTLVWLFNMVCWLTFLDIFRTRCMAQKTGDVTN